MAVAAVPMLPPTRRCRELLSPCSLADDVTVACLQLLRIVPAQVNDFDCTACLAVLLSRQDGDQI
uniref:Uncharacterized protein n=1 Tax=Oryza barthii TaxID=65489 RepID=A0A0D3GRT7_9ORYZ